LGRNISGEELPKFLTQFINIWFTIDGIEHVSKFVNDRPSDLGDQTLKTEKETNDNTKTE